MVDPCKGTGQFMKPLLDGCSGMKNEHEAENFEGLRTL